MAFVSPDRIEGIAKVMSPFIRKTPLQAGTGPYQNLLFKREDLQITNSFTVRAAFGILMGLSKRQLEHGIVLTTPGNLGWGLAYALNRLKLPTKLHIVIPEDAVGAKRDGLLSLASDQIQITQKGNSELERYEVVREIAKSQGFQELELHNRQDEVAAKGSIAVEIHEDLSHLEHGGQLGNGGSHFEFYCPIGSGALAAGCAIWLKARLGSRVRIIGAEPANANDFSRLFYQNEKSSNLAPSTIADSLRSPQVRTEYQDSLLELVDEVIEVDENEILEEMKSLYETSQIVGEPSSVITLRAAKQAKPSNTTTRICLLTAANVDRSAYEFWG